MEDNFNGLTPEETERLSILLEECSEVIQVIGKTLRHGYESFKPSDPNKETNREKLEKEIADVIVSVDLLINLKDLNPDSIINHGSKRYSRYKNGGGYIHHTKIV